MWSSFLPHRSLLACSGFKVRVRVNDVQNRFLNRFTLYVLYARGDDRIGLQADTNTLLHARM